MSRASARSSSTASPARDGRTPSARCACTWELRNAVCRRAPTPAAALPSSSIWCRISRRCSSVRAPRSWAEPRRDSRASARVAARPSRPPGPEAVPTCASGDPHRHRPHRHPARLLRRPTRSRQHPPAHHRRDDASLPPPPQGVRLTPPGQPLHRTLGATTDRPTGAGLLPTHVALLRGINVGRGSRFALADLRPVVAELGHGRWPPTCTRATWCSPPPVTACLQRWPSG